MVEVVEAVEGEEVVVVECRRKSCVSSLEMAAETSWEDTEHVFGLRWMTTEYPCNSWSECSWRSCTPSIRKKPPQFRIDWMLKMNDGGGRQ